MDSYDWKRENLNISHIDIYQKKQPISKQVKVAFPYVVNIELTI